ncbi:ABC transporter permease [Dyella halodurans]|uniref:ABC transporter permease n=1 Tax=Dyella halodurans TaxID=1920171 RepID=A0ABV9BXP6_9GAMM|nr:FtsX-like permease family protein [Dyella halodurans]
MDILPILSTLRRHKITAFLVIIEIALTCAIVCNAVFLINQRLDRMHMTSGVAEHELLEILFADIGPNKNQKARTAEDLAALRQIPGVLQVSSANQVPFGNSSWNGGIKLDRNQRVSTLNATTYTGENVLQTLGTQLVEGRNLQPDDYMDFDDVVRAASVKDAKGIPKVTVITQSLAQRLWPGQQPLGKVIYYADYPMTVVGVVKHLVRPAFTDNATAEFTMVLPMRITQGLYIIRTDPQNRDAVLKAAVAKMKAINPHRVILKQRPWDEVRSNFFQNDRAMAGLLVGVCIALLVVTALGIVGLGSFWVAQRRRQIGVRRALGATRRNILHYFQTENFLLATIGIALGMVLAYGINLMLMLHYELPRLPAIYFPVGALSLWVIGQLAVLGPAMRAAAVPPVVATRSV